MKCPAVTEWKRRRVPDARRNISAVERPNRRHLKRGGGLGGWGNLRFEIYDFRKERRVVCAGVFAVTVRPEDSGLDLMAKGWSARA